MVKLYFTRLELKLLEKVKLFAQSAICERADIFPRENRPRRGLFVINSLCRASKMF